MKAIGAALLMTMLAACALDVSGVPIDDGDDAIAPDAPSIQHDEIDARPMPPPIDAAPTPTTTAPGGACSCDTDCTGDTAHAGVCVFGICMTRAASACASGGSQAECPTGSRCWGVNGADDDVCWPDCAAHSCVGTCDSDGSCVPGSDNDCDGSCAAACGN